MDKTTSQKITKYVHSSDLLDIAAIEKINICINKIKQNNSIGNQAASAFFYFNISCFVMSFLLFYTNSIALKIVSIIPFLFFLFNFTTLIFMSFETVEEIDNKKSFYSKWTDNSFFLIEKLREIITDIKRKTIEENEHFIINFLSEPINQAKLVLPLCDLYYQRIDLGSQISLPDNLLNSLEEKNYINFCNYYVYVDKFIDDVNHTAYLNNHIFTSIIPHKYYLYLKKYETSYHLNKKLENKLKNKKPENNIIKRNKI